MGILGEDQSWSMVPTFYQYPLVTSFSSVKLPPALFFQCRVEALALVDASVLGDEAGKACCWLALQGRDGVGPHLEGCVQSRWCVVWGHERGLRKRKHWAKRELPTYAWKAGGWRGSYIMYCKHYVTVKSMSLAQVDLCSIPAQPCTSNWAMTSPLGLSDFSSVMKE